jgi:hypothetical protein
VIFNGSVFPDPEGVIQILREQAADLKKPPKTFDDILCALAVPAPGFVTTIQNLTDNLNQ